jgi:DNA-binding CsgD family transcriptional regulator
VSGNGEHPGHARLLADLAAVSLELTAREKQALGLVSHGLTQKAAAAEMNYSVQYVDDLLEYVRIKLDVKTTLHACCEAIRKGIIP